MSGPAPIPEPERIAVVPAVEPRQRWRLVVGRAADAPTGAHRDVTDAWVAGLESTDLPLARTPPPAARARVSFGAPLQVGMPAEGELIDVVLVERWPAWRVRASLDGHVPAGWRLVDLYDVWLAGPPLAGRVAAADYRITLGDALPDIDAVRRAAEDLLRADRLPRERSKGGGTVRYDLRPLLADIAVEPGPPPIIRARTRFHPELGTGRPEEVVAALGDHIGVALSVDTIVRERLLLVDDLP